MPIAGLQTAQTSRALSREKDIERLLDTISTLEKDLWLQGTDKALLTAYQEKFRQLEKLYAESNDPAAGDERYHFKIVIPVADRPQHLRQCLYSLKTLCESYHYGGCVDGRYPKVSVLIADDSSHSGNIAQHRLLCRELNDSGIETHYFGLEEQLALAREYSARAELGNILGDLSGVNNARAFAHKGASIMRNISYLKLKQMISDNNTLIYFIDSDQEFCVNTPEQEKYYAVNFFHYLDRLFKSRDISLLTGKVVGDPPVSPAVMAANFQQDVLAFLHAQASLRPDDACCFHEHERSDTKDVLPDDAAYHDMAGLFGFDQKQKSFRYRCQLSGRHSNADCLADFSEKLQHFFYGEHPTRKTFFQYGEGFDDTTPARTVYTGNYVCTRQALDYFIPFASLKLRMAGPVLGRLLKSELKQAFVSANLPMLHTRTVEDTGRSEFRPGVESRSDNSADGRQKQISLETEFIRQFYGDVMLFAMEKLTAAGFPQSAPDPSFIEQTLQDTYREMRQNYTDKHNTILQLKNSIETFLNHKEHWWHRHDHEAATDNYRQFLQNIQLNFDDDTRAFQSIISDARAQVQLEKIQQAILAYTDDRRQWQQAQGNT